MDYETVKTVTVPLLKPSLDTPFFVKILTKIVQSKAIESKTGKKRDMEPAFVCHVVNLEDEAAGTMEFIVNAVLKSALDEEYPSDSYVGKCFRLIKHAKAEGKQYHKFTIAEIKPKGKK